MKPLGDELRGFASDVPHSLERPDVSVLTLVGLQLLPLAEVLAAAVVVTLQPSHSTAAAHHQQSVNVMEQVMDLVPGTASPACHERGPRGSSGCRW